MRTTHKLRFASEADAINTLPMLRGVDDDGQPVWLRDGEHHCIVAGIVIVVTEAVMSEDGEEVIEPPVLSPFWHADLLLLISHPDREALLAAIEPFEVHPANPRHDFS